MYFRNSGHFFQLSEKFVRTEHGAGELGPLGSACSEILLPKKQQHRNQCCAIDDGKFGHRFIHAFSACCSGASVVAFSRKIRRLVSSAMLYLSWIFREQWFLSVAVQLSCFINVTASSRFWRLFNPLSRLRMDFKFFESLRWILWRHSLFTSARVPMAPPNLRCTGRHKLWCSQNVLAPLKLMRLF